jgi:hypothetical protein
VNALVLAAHFAFLSSPPKEQKGYRGRQTIVALY